MNFHFFKTWLTSCHIRMCQNWPEDMDPKFFARISALCGTLFQKLYIFQFYEQHQLILGIGDSIIMKYRAQKEYYITFLVFTLFSRVDLPYLRQISKSNIFLWNQTYKAIALYVWFLFDSHSIPIRFDRKMFDYVWNKNEAAL